MAKTTQTKKPSRAAKTPAPSGRTGRKPVPQERRKHYSRRPLSLREDHWKNLEDLAKALHTNSRSGANHGNPSWRTLIAMLADEAPGIIETMKTHKAANAKQTTFTPLVIHGERILLTPPEKEETHEIATGNVVDRGAIGT